MRIKYRKYDIHCNIYEGMLTKYLKCAGNSASFNIVTVKILLKYCETIINSWEKILITLP